MSLCCPRTVNTALDLLYFLYGTHTNRKEMRQVSGLNSGRLLGRRSEERGINTSNIFLRCTGQSLARRVRFVRRKGIASVSGRENDRYGKVRGGGRLGRALSGLEFTRTMLLAAGIGLGFSVGAAY